MGGKGAAALRRIGAILLILSAALAAPCAVVAGETGLDPVRLQLKWRHQFQFAGYYAAIAKGYYASAGLRVELIEATDEEEPARVVLRGAAEYGIATSDLVLFRSQGDKVVALVAIFQHSPLVLIVPRRSGIEHLHELDGRRVMIEHHAAELLAYIRQEGIRLERLRMLPHNFDVKSLVAGEVDAISAYSTDEPFLLQQAGLEFHAFSPRSGGIDFYGDTLFTTEAEVRRNPRRVAAFVDATLKGWSYALDHPQEIVDLILSRYSQRHSRAHLLFEAERTQRLIRHELVELGYMNPGRWRHIAETYAELKMMPAGFSLDGFLWRPVERIDLTKFQVAIAASVAVALVIALLTLRFYRLNVNLNRQIAQREALQAELRRLADVDVLTGISSRRHFLEQFEQEIERGRRYDRPLAVLMLDIDRFKSVNDSYGHAAGDEVLRRVCAAIRAELRQSDHFGRLGGEEFGVLLPETARADAVLTAERLRQTVQALEIVFEGQAVELTISVGATQVGSEDDDSSALARADHALYAAKQGGRNCIMWQDEPGKSGAVAEA